ncbi:luc7-like protein 3 [Ambystoma mexicanum]|uniref:luc7-like protein 3 n=1 Tax=Ambystoma mexicanum TaxID=8296 RepID=UPI0037E707DC
MEAILDDHKWIRKLNQQSALRSDPKRSPIRDRDPVDPRRKDLEDRRKTDPEMAKTKEKVGGPLVLGKGIKTSKPTNPDCILIVEDKEAKSSFAIFKEPPQQLGKNSTTAKDPLHKDQKETGQKKAKKQVCKRKANGSRAFLRNINLPIEEPEEPLPKKPRREINLLSVSKEKVVQKIPQDGESVLQKKNGRDTSGCLSDLIEIIEETREEEMWDDISLSEWQEIDKQLNDVPTGKESRTEENQRVNKLTGKIRKNENDKQRQDRSHYPKDEHRNAIRNTRDRHQASRFHRWSEQRDRVPKDEKENAKRRPRDKYRENRSHRWSKSPCKSRDKRAKDLKGKKIDTKTQELRSISRDKKRSPNNATKSRDLLKQLEARRMARRQTSIWNLPRKTPRYRSPEKSMTKDQQGVRWDTPGEYEHFLTLKLERTWRDRRRIVLNRNRVMSILKDLPASRKIHTDDVAIVEFIDEEKPDVVLLHLTTRKLKDSLLDVKNNLESWGYRLTDPDNKSTWREANTHRPVDDRVEKIIKTRERKPINTRQEERSNQKLNTRQDRLDTRDRSSEPVRKINSTQRSTDNQLTNLRFTVDNSSKKTKRAGVSNRTLTKVESRGHTPSINPEKKRQ